MKSLGLLEYPDVVVERFNGGSGEVVLKLSDRGKSVRIRMSVFCVKKMMKTAHEIVGKQRAFALSELEIYEDLRQATGFKEPDREN